MTDAAKGPVRSEPGAGETRELRILYQMAAVLGRSLELDELLVDALQTIEALLSIPLSAVYLIDDRAGEGDRIKLASYRGFSPDSDVADLPADPAEPWFQACIDQTRPYVAREPLGDRPNLVSASDKRQGVQAWAMIPLVSRGRVLGVLRVASRSLEKLSADEVELLETIGPDLGVAIDNARLFTLVQRGRDEWLTTFDSVEDRLAVLGADLTVIRANRALLSGLDRPPAEIIGRACAEIFPETCATTGCPHRAALNGIRTEREVKAGDRILQVVVYPSATGGAIHVAKDITAERKREQQLVQAEKLSAASTVLAGVAHELSNPLTVVIAYADLLSQLDETAPYREEVQQILRSALRCQAIVRNLLAFSRQSTPERSEVDVNALVRETLPLFAYQLRVAGIRVEERLSPAVPIISADRNRLQVIIVNLLNNAYQAIAPLKREGYLRVATRPRQGGVEIEVEDDGPGIDAGTLERVFEPFFTTKDPGQGTGLGLSLSLSIARDHGGDIKIQSELGRGTTVSLHLPLGPPLAPRPEIAELQPGCLAGRTVLVVDDEPDVRALVSTALEMYGARVVTAENGVEALALVESGQAFDVVFTDLRMPEMGGDELVAALRRLAPAIVERVLLTTGDVAAPAADEAIRRTGRPHLAKPFNVRELVGAILAILDRGGPGLTGLRPHCPSVVGACYDPRLEEPPR